MITKYIKDGKGLDRFIAIFFGLKYVRMALVEILDWKVECYDK